jgi:hypothetical protein
MSKRRIIDHLRHIFAKGHGPLGLHLLTADFTAKLDIHTQLEGRYIDLTSTSILGRELNDGKNSLALSSLDFNPFDDGFSKTPFVCVRVTQASEETFHLLIRYNSNLCRVVKMSTSQAL